MHQYGLNRSENNLTKMCEGVIPGPTTGVKRCYWAALPKLSDFLKGLNVVDPIIDQDIANGPFCPPRELNIKTPDSLDEGEAEVSNISLPEHQLPLHHEQLIKLITRNCKTRCHACFVLFTIIVTNYFLS